MFWCRGWPDVFLDEFALSRSSWQALERNVSRLLMLDGFDGVRLVGQTKDFGADLIARKGGKRWLFQVKNWKAKVGVKVADRTIAAAKTYAADVPVIVAPNGFDEPLRAHQQTLLSQGIPLQLWDGYFLGKRAQACSGRELNRREPREYQETAIRLLLQTIGEGSRNHALVVMATGLGKTFTLCETIRRLRLERPELRVLSIVHTNDLVLQLEKSFWNFIDTDTETVVWNEHERPTDDQLREVPLVFGCVNSVYHHLESTGSLPDFDVLVIDECHHVGGQMYESILEHTRAGIGSGPFLIGLTATPWRPDNKDLEEYFGEELVTIDMVTGLRKGFLAHVDYRLYTDNINWDALHELHGERLSPRAINKTLFIQEWDDAIIDQLQSEWQLISNPRAIVFCGTINHAITTRDRINARGFCNAQAIYSQSKGGVKLEAYERNRLLCDFADGKVNVICAVDIFNEGIDVPDVNLIVFQRVTHSRRIFVQQLGRGLRVAPDKDKVVVLDFVSDIRRIAAGLDLQSKLTEPTYVELGHRVTFQRAGEADPKGEAFLKSWLDDVIAIEQAGDDVSVLKFPPEFD
jgi:superfamily II DNA or RNA helicase